MDEMGGNVGVSTPYAQDPPPIPEAVYHTFFSDSEMKINGQMVTCMIDGSAAKCSTVQGLANAGALVAETQFATKNGIVTIPSDIVSYGVGIYRYSLPDVFTNNTGAIWGQPHGSRAEGWRIFEGGDFSISFGTGQEDGDVKPAVFVRTEEDQKKFEECFSNPFKEYQTSVDTLNAKNDVDLEGTKRQAKYSLYANLFPSAGPGIISSLKDVRSLESLSFKWGFKPFSGAARGVLYFNVATQLGLVYDKKWTLDQKGSLDFIAYTEKFLDAYKKCRNTYPATIPKLVNKPNSIKEAAIIQEFNNRGKPAKPDFFPWWRQNTHHRDNFYDLLDF